MDPTNQPRVALVTGAARGIGAATVRALCAKGYRVVAVDSCAGAGHGLPGVGHSLGSREELDHLIAGCEERAVALAADVRHLSELQAAAELAVERWGRLDVAVAAAAVLSGGRPVWQTPPDELDALWQVIVVGVWNAAVATVPRMLAGPAPGGCRFVAVTSPAASRGIFHLGGYVATKHAVLGIVRGLAADLVGTGVTAAAVSPGPTRSSMLAATAALYGVAEEDLSRTLVGGALDPAEIAATIAFCCSPAGRVLDGSEVRADGGVVG